MARVCPRTLEVLRLTRFGGHDGDQIWWIQLTWIRGAAVGLLSWCILIFDRRAHPRAVWRPCPLWKISKVFEDGVGQFDEGAPSLHVGGSSCLQPLVGEYLSMLSAARHHESHSLVIEAERSLRVLRGLHRQAGNIAWFELE